MSDERAGDEEDGVATDDPEEIEPESVPEGATENHWKQLVVEMGQSAEEHRNAGWRTVVLHPEASGVIDDDEPGIGVVVPREEFEELDGVASSRRIDEYEVLRADLPDEVQTLTILYSADAEVAVFVPAALDAERLEELRGTVGDTLYTHVTPPTDDATISFTHDDPGLFFPGTEMPRTARTREGTPGTSDQSAAESGDGSEES